MGLSFRRRHKLVASLLVLSVPATMGLSALAATGADIDRAESANYLRSNDGGSDFDPQSLDNVGSGVAQVTQVESEDGTVHALFSTNNDDDDFVFPFELYHRRSTNSGRDFDAEQQLDDDGGVSSEPSLATTGDDVHVAYEENRLEFGVDADGNNVIDEEDEFPEEVYYTRSTNEGADFSPSINLSDTAFAQETDNDTAASGDRVVVVYESNVIDPDDFDVPPVIPAEQETTARDIVIRVSNDRGANFAAPLNLTFDGTDDLVPLTSDDLDDQGQDQPKVGLSGDDGDDVVLVVFRVSDADGAVNRTGYVRSTDGGASFGPIVLLPSDADVATLPALHMDGNEAHVMACDALNRLLYWNSDDAGASFEGPEVIHAGSEPCTKPAIDGNGDDLHVAFLQEVAGEPDVLYIRSTDGGDDWSKARNLTANHGQGEFPSVAVDTEDEDEVHITWHDVSDLLISVKHGDTLPQADGDGRHFSNEDVVRYHGSTYSKVLDGSDVGLRNLRIDAMAVIEPAEEGLPDRYLLSFTEKGRVPGISGKVDDSDVVLFTPTSLGEDTEGTFELFFNGSRIGLSRSGEDIDAIEVDGSDLYFSTYGDFHLTPALADLRGKNEDVFVCRDATVTSCAEAEVVFDGSARELSDSDENVDAFAFGLDGNGPGSQAFFSTNEDFKTETARGEDNDLFSCLFPEEDQDDDDVPIPGTFDGDLADCGGVASPFARTFIGDTNRIDEDLMSVDVQF
ncbi:MAG: hypothetical protein ACRDZ3_10855 [Acidimicrobiia bacterium]